MDSPLDDSLDHAVGHGSHEDLNVGGTGTVLVEDESRAG